MFEVNIYGNPPTAEAVRKLRANSLFEDSVAFKVLMFTPIPGIDILAALATHAIEVTVFGKDFQPCKGALAIDWSESLVTNSYVEKVRGQGRELIGVEVDALKRHLSVERTVKAAASAVADVVLAKGKDAILEAAAAAGGSFANGIQNLFGTQSNFSNQDLEAPRQV